MHGDGFVIAGAREHAEYFRGKRQEWYGVKVKDELYFGELKMNYEKFGKSKASGGLMYLIHLDVYHQHFVNGLSLQQLVLTETDHWNLHGLSY